jgi:hypothetical protein
MTCVGSQRHRKKENTFLISCSLPNFIKIRLPVLWLYADRQTKRLKDRYDEAMTCVGSKKKKKKKNSLIPNFIKIRLAVCGQTDRYDETYARLYFCLA